MRSQALMLLLICAISHTLTTLQWHRTVLEIPMPHDEYSDLPSLEARKIPTNASDTSSVKHHYYSGKHPHFGALDENLRAGYIHDPTILHRRNSSNFTILSEERGQLCAKIGQGPEGGDDLGRELFEHHIQVSPSSFTVSVFCGIYTYPGNRHQADAIADTWGKRCDGIMFASTETIHDNAVVNLPHAGEHQGRYKGIWQKVRSMLGYIYDNFLEEYDFFFFSGDDTYVIVENLKEFLVSPEIQRRIGNPEDPKPFFTGSWIHPFWLLKEGYSTDFYYMGGGGGYVLSRAAVKRLVEQAWPTCHNETDDFSEDVYMAECLMNYLNVTGYDSRDNRGGERFIPYDLVKRASISRAFSGSEPVKKTKQSSAKLDNLDKARQEHLAFRQQGIWRQMKHNWTQLFGIDYASPSAISFHMVQPAIKMKRYEQLFYHVRREGFNVSAFCGNEK